MKKHGITTFIYIIVVVTFALSVYTFVQYILLESELNQIVSSLSKEATDEISFGVDTDVVSVSLGIITAGIGLFALFGGILSIFNIKQSKELDIAISDAREALENQYELQGARLIQEGRVYVLRNRYKYAVNNFNQVIETLPGSISALICEFEIFSLYADILPLEYKERLNEQFETLIRKLDSCNGHVNESKMLKADAYFTYGCVCGNYALNENGQKRKMLLDKSIEAFSNAIALDSSNVDFYRNQAISYALTDDIDNCKLVLQKGFILSKSDILYSYLVDKERLKKLFEQSVKDLSTPIKEMIATEFGVLL